MKVKPLALAGLPEEVALDLRYIVTEAVWLAVEDRKDLVHAWGSVKGGPMVDGIKVKRGFRLHPRHEMEEFFAAKGFYTGGVVLEKPAKCGRCKSWFDEAQEPFPDVPMIGTHDGKIVVLCPRCRPKKLSQA